MTKVYCDACGLEGAKPGAMTLNGVVFDLGDDCIAKVRAVLDNKLLQGGTTVLTSEPATVQTIQAKPL